MRIFCHLEEAAPTQATECSRTTQGATQARQGRRRVSLPAALVASAYALSTPGCVGTPLAPTVVDDGATEPPEPTTSSHAVISADDVLFSLRNKRAEARRCFELNGSKGSVHLRWQVTPLGDVQEIERVSSDTDQNTNRCLVDFASGLHFNPREDRADAQWTFVHGVTGSSTAQRSPKRKRRDRERGTGPTIDPGSPGRLALDEIENVADNGFRLYAHCMRDGLNRNETLSGRVLLRFRIDRGGQVDQVEDAGSDLPDPNVVDCVAEGFYAMTFPKPDGGPVRLEYSILLNEE